MSPRIRICRASRILEEVKSYYVAKDYDPQTFYMLLGAYMSRTLGLCIIRPNWEIEDILEELRVWFEGDKRRAQELIKQFHELVTSGEDQE